MDELVDLAEFRLEEVRKILIRAGLSRREKIDKVKKQSVNHKPSHEVIDELICNGQFVEEVDEEKG
jgi:hypothetical protein